MDRREDKHLFGAWFTPDEISCFFAAPAGPVAGDDLIHEVFGARNISSVRQKLIVEPANLDPNKASVSHECQKLTFLIAVSYEMERKTDQAVEEFASIMRASESTLWQNLAELHVRAR